MISLGIDIGGSFVKAALVDGRTTLAESQSARYRRPSPEELGAAIRGAASATGALARPYDVVGVCAPGVLDGDGVTVRASVNVPSLVGVRLDALIRSALNGGTAGTRVFSDAHAAAFDLWSRERRLGRFVGVSIGTGVGACVLDSGAPLRVTGNSSGHVGQIDVSIEGADEPVPVGPDGGRGSLEAYMGLPALEQRYGAGVESAIESFKASDVPLRALARGLRVIHAIYRPDTVALLGGVGIRLRPALPALLGLVSESLTGLARPGWTLLTGDSQFHAAVGAAKLAGDG